MLRASTASWFTLAQLVLWWFCHEIVFLIYLSTPKWVGEGEAECSFRSLTFSSWDVLKFLIWRQMYLLPAVLPLRDAFDSESFLSYVAIGIIRIRKKVIFARLGEWCLSRHQRASEGYTVSQLIHLRICRIEFSGQFLSEWFHVIERFVTFLNFESISWE